MPTTTPHRGGHSRRKPAVAAAVAVATLAAAGALAIGAAHARAHIEQEVGRG
ncbi:hypothetical protein [Micromonospora sp. NPDC005652]|uniref:hypothetical protein n=1 Tax=Micromonospora sp. NPDC005652 TaxID=3157046 RepID=UPI0033EEDCD4